MFSGRSLKPMEGRGGGAIEFDGYYFLMFCSLSINSVYLSGSLKTCGQGPKT